MPIDRVCRQQMTKKLSDDAQAIGLVAMNGLVVLNELAFEEITPEAIKLTEPRTH